MSDESKKRATDITTENAVPVVSIGQSVKDNGLSSLMLSSLEAAKLLGICRSHFLSLHSSGRIGPLPIKLGMPFIWQMLCRR